jgi:hypothetical protein
MVTTLSELATRAEAQAHDVRPADSPSGKEMARRGVLRKVYHCRVPDDAAAATQLAEHVIVDFPESEFPDGVLVVSVSMRSGVITGHASETVTDTIKSVDSDGGAVDTLGLFTNDTDVTVPNGGLGGTTTSMKSYPMVLDGTALEVPAGGGLSLTRAKATGQQVIGCTYTVTVEAL